MLSPASLVMQPAVKEHTGVCKHKLSCGIGPLASERGRGVELAAPAQQAGEAPDSCMMCRKHDDGEEEGTQEPQGAVTVTETFPDGTSNPENDSYPIAVDDQAHAPGAACSCILAGLVKMQLETCAKTGA